VDERLLDGSPLLTLRDDVNATMDLELNALAEGSQPY
jgi:hypothetical protein